MSRRSLRDDAIHMIALALASGHGYTSAADVVDQDPDPDAGRERWEMFREQGELVVDDLRRWLVSERPGAVAADALGGHVAASAAALKAVADAMKETP